MAKNNTAEVIESIGTGLSSVINAGANAFYQAPTVSPIAPPANNNNANSNNTNNSVGLLAGSGGLLIGLIALFLILKK